MSGGSFGFSTRVFLLMLVLAAGVLFLSPRVLPRTWGSFPFLL